MAAETAMREQNYREGAAPVMELVFIFIFLFQSIFIYIINTYMFMVIFLVLDAGGSREIAGTESPLQHDSFCSQVPHPCQATATRIQVGQC